MLTKKVLLSCIVLLLIALSPIASQPKETLAVLDFTTEAVSKTDMKAIVEFLSGELFSIRKYTVIDVSQRETILNEMEFSMSGCSDETCALEIGQLLSAELIVVGTLSKIGSRFLLSVKMLETETSRTMGTANGKYRNLDELIDGLNTVAVNLAAEEAKTRTGEAPADAALQPDTEEQSDNETADTAETIISVDDSAEITETITAETSADDDTAEETAANEAALPPEKPPVEINKELILPIACTAGGVIGIGVGTYFIINLFSNSLPAYVTARSAYTNATDISSSEVTALYDVSESTYKNAMNDLIIGSSVAGVGVILTIVGIILFPPSDEAEQTVSLLPAVNGTPGIAVRVSY